MPTFKTAPPPCRVACADSENTMEDHGFICVFGLMAFARLAIFAVRRCTPFADSRSDNLRAIVRDAS
jgi:hypothetical protein